MFVWGSEVTGDRLQEKYSISPNTMNCKGSWWLPGEIDAGKPVLKYGNNKGQIRLHSIEVWS